MDPNSVGTSPTLSHVHPHISKEDATQTDGEGAAKEAAKLGREALGDAAPVSPAGILFYICFMLMSNHVDRRRCPEGTALSSASPRNFRKSL